MLGNPSTRDLKPQIGKNSKTRKPHHSVLVPSLHRRLGPSAGSARLEEPREVRDAWRCSFLVGVAECLKWTSDCSWLKDGEKALFEICSVSNLCLKISQELGYCAADFQVTTNLELALR